MKGAVFTAFLVWEVFRSFGVHTMRLIAYIRKRLRRLIAVVFFLLLCLVVVVWWLVHFRLRQSLRVLVAEESKGRLALEVGEAGISFTRGTLRLREVRLYTPDMVGGTAVGGTAGARGAAYDVRIPEVYLSLASWKALLMDRKLLVDSLAIRASSVWMSGGVRDTGAVRRPWRLEDAKNALDTALRRMNVHAFSLQADSVRLDGDGSPRLVVRNIGIVIKDFVRRSGGGLGFVPGHLFTLALGALRWEAPERGQWLSMGRMSFDSRSRRFESDSVSFRQEAAGSAAYRFMADRCYFRSADLIEALSSQRFVLDTIVCVNPVLEQPMGVGSRPDSQRVSTSSVSILVRYVAVINGQVRLGGSKGVVATGLSTRKANCRIYGLSIDGSRKFPIRTDSVRLRLDQLVFRTRDGRYALTVAGLGLAGNDAVFQGVAFGPVRKNEESSTVFTAPELRLRNISIDRLLEGRLQADGAVLRSPRVMMRKGEGGTSQGSGGVATDGKAVSGQRRMALFYRTLHDLREIIDAGSLDFSDGEIRYTRLGDIPVEAVASGCSAHILLNAVLGSDDLLDIKRAIPEAGLGHFHVSAGGQELDISRYRFSGTKRHSEDKEVRVVLKNGLSVVLRRVEWGTLDWDAFQRSGIVRFDSLHIGGVDVRQKVGGVVAGQVTGGVGAGQMTGGVGAGPVTGGVGATRGGGLHLDIGAFRVDSLFYERQDIRFRLAALAVSALRTADNLLRWDQISAKVDSFRWQKEDARVSAATMLLDSRAGLRVFGVEARFPAARGRVEASAPLVVVKTPVLAAAIPASAVVRVPQATVHFERVSGSDSLTVGAVVEMTAGVVPGKTLRLYSLDCNWKDAWARIGSATRQIEVSGAVGRLLADTFRVTGGRPTDWRDWLALVRVERAAVRCKMPALRAGIGDVSWDPAGRELRLANIDIRPIPVRDSMFRRSVWQGDYLAGSAAAVVLHGIRLKGEARKPSVDIDRVRIEGAVLDASRDKNMPFHHGIQKPMPTKLLATISADIHIQQLSVNDSKVTYHERSAVTGRWGWVSLDRLNAVLGPLTSRSGKDDTLALDASAVLFDGHIRRFHYRESYGDPHSGFEARVSFSPLDLTRLSDMSSPAGAVAITGGHVDTAWAVWRGNRYAAYGLMNLRYRDLQVKVLNKKDSIRAGLLPALETFAANLLLPGHNRRGSLIYFERDQEKFVFNYWIKTQASGIVSTMLHKKNEAYRRLYEERRKGFYLPPADLWNVDGVR